MERRDFFNRLIWGGAALAVAPVLFAEIVDHDYPAPPEELFAEGQGLWLFKNNKLVAFSNLHGVVLSMNREVRELTQSPWWFGPDEYKGYREYIPGPIKVWYDIKNLEIINDEILQMPDYKYRAIMKTDNTIESDVIISELGISSRISERPIHSARLMCIGETTITFEKG